MVEYKLLDFLGYPGYRVGSDGSVWSYIGLRSCRFWMFGPWYRLQVRMARGKYPMVWVSNGNENKQEYVQILVAKAFGLKDEEKKFVGHKNGNLRDCSLENLYLKKYKRW